MCYSAAALAFMLTQIDFPVVLTGSSQPPNHADSDADKNVADSILAALQLPDGVFTVFANDDNVSFVHDATAVRKFYRDGQLFHSVNRPPAAEIKDGQFKANHFRSHSPVKAKIAVENSVVMLQLYPGIDLESFFEMISRQQAKGVVISLYPAMTGPGTPPKSSLELFLKKCDQAKITVVLTLPTLREGMNMNNFYDSTLAMHNSNAIFLPTLPETAYVKTVWALAQGRKSRKLLQQDICGEFEKITS
jgi:L-asparaginase/Glu-tRNA(Gln) amidotransferase subunit D